MIAKMDELVFKLAQEGKWNTIFKDTVFSVYGIVWNSGGSSSSGININLSKWLTATKIIGTDNEGYKWGCVQDIYTHMAGKVSLEENSITFGPVHDNPMKLLASRTYLGENRMVDWTDNFVESSTNWKVELSGTSGGKVLLKIGIFDPLAPLVKGTIGTFDEGAGYSTISINILDPGPDLLKEFCTNVNNITSSICVSWCSVNPSVCEEHKLALCAEGNNIFSNFCEGYCARNTSKCDNILTESCNNQLVNTFNGSVSGLMNSPLKNSCACFLPKATMDGYSVSLQNMFKSYVDKGTAKCFFPECSRSETTIKPFAWKVKSCDNCPIESKCILDVNINNQGNIQGAPHVSNSEDCIAFGATEPFEEKLNRKELCSSNVVNNPVKVSGGHKKIIIGVALAGGIGFLVMGTIYAIFKKKKKI